MEGLLGLQGARRGPNRPTEGQGSVLLLAVILVCVLSALLLVAANTALLGTQALEGYEQAARLFYIAEAGLAHGQAFCRARGEGAVPFGGAPAQDEPGPSGGSGDPFNEWLPFDGGAYRVEAYRLGVDDQPYLVRESGILLVSTARDGGEARKTLCLVLDDPPSWEPLAWWEPE